MAIITEFQPRNVAQTSFKFEGKKFIIREPKAEEVNAADLIRSRAFYAAIKGQLPTELEVLELLSKQKRFSIKEYEEKTNEYRQKIQEIISKIEKSQNEEELRSLLEECKDIRAKFTELSTNREYFLQHSAERKASNEYNLALMGACLFDSTGKPVFGSISEFNGCIDVEEAYQNIKNNTNWAFLTECIANFIPFSAGIINPHTPDQEDVIYSKRRKELNLPHDEISQNIEDYENEVSLEDEGLERKIVPVDEKSEEKQKKETEPKIVKEKPQATRQQAPIEEKNPPVENIFEESDFELTKQVEEKPVEQNQPIDNLDDLVPQRQEPVSSKKRQSDGEVKAPIKSEESVSDETDDSRIRFSETPLGDGSGRPA